ncbi:uncharacterized protein BDV17DRAFT_274666 [Aspergillus undulatus]|uniref:uncharacterized protein n=1 Tax=Aspergillus undulatus TaxID=1810928 RepID=UPI003CCCEC2B
MGFWKGWALWQKLSVALAFLLLLVLVYSFSVLTYNRRKIRRQAAEEASQRAQQIAEMGEVGSDGNEVPFGARALEKGIEVEGIWTMKRNSLAKPPSISEKRRSSILGSLLRHKSAASTLRMAHTQPEPTIAPSSSTSHRTSDAGDSQTTESVLESIHIDTFRSSRPPQLDIGGRDLHRLSEHERPLSRGWFASRSSWMKPIVGYKRMSVREGEHQSEIARHYFMLDGMAGFAHTTLGRRRGSSEDFRRRFSKLFDETLPPGPPRPAEMFQLTPIYQDPAESSGKPSLENINEPLATK